jgi:hypothetical protein
MGWLPVRAGDTRETVILADVIGHRPYHDLGDVRRYADVVAQYEP